MIAFCNCTSLAFVFEHGRCEGPKCNPMPRTRRSKNCAWPWMVRLWIEQFNRGGIDALITKPRPGRPRKVKLERVRDLLVPVLENPAQAGQVHWTGVKVHGYLKEKLAIELGYRTAIRW